MTPCKFTFDATPAFDGFALGSTWNGFDNVSVTPEDRDGIAAYFRREGDTGTADDLLGIEPERSGLICLGWGYVTQVIELNGAPVPVAS
jgi:hypothetical protein